MLNYLSAELWRMTRRKLPPFVLLVYLLLVAMMAFIWGLDSLESALEGFYDFLFFGLYLCLPIAAQADGDSGRLGTLKNETSCGVTRGRIYVGKLLAGLTAGLVLFLTTFAVFLTVAVAASAGTYGGEEIARALARLWEGVLNALPRYFGALGLAHLLCFSLRTGGLAATLYYLYITLGEVVLSTIQITGLGMVGDAVNVVAVAIRPYLLSGTFFSYSAVASMGTVQSWLIGLGWLVLTTALGVLLFRRREIR